MRQAWLPASPEGAPQARAIVREGARELRLDGETAWELMLATTEAFANAVEHGVPCPSRGIFLRMENGGGSVRIEVGDCGRGFEPGTPTSKLPGHGGRGMPIIAAVMDRVEVMPRPGATTVRFEKRVPVAA